MAYAKPTVILFEKVPCTSTDKYKASRGFMESFIDGIEGAEVVSKIVTGSVYVGSNSPITITDEELFFAKVGKTYVAFLSGSTWSYGAAPVFYREKSGSIFDISSFTVDPFQSSGVPFFYILKCGDVNVLSNQGKTKFITISKETCAMYNSNNNFCSYYDTVVENAYNMNQAGASIIYPRSSSYSNAKIVTLVKAHVNVYSDIEIPIYFVDTPPSATNVYERFLHIGDAVYLEYNSLDSNTGHARPCFRVGTLD